jgi:hypothetical protein
MTHVRVYAFIQRNKRIQPAWCQRIEGEIWGGDFAELLQSGSCKKGLTREVLQIKNMNRIKRAQNYLLCNLHSSELRKSIAMLFTNLTSTRIIQVNNISAPLWPLLVVKNSWAHTCTSTYHHVAKTILRSTELAEYLLSTSVCTSTSTSESMKILHG